MTATEMAQNFDLRANQITRWKTLMLEHAADVFEAASSSSTPPVDVNRSHAKIGEQALENELLGGTLTKAGGGAQSDDRP